MRERDVFAEKSAAVKRINMENGKRDGHARARDCNLGIVCKNGEFASIRIEPGSLANTTERRVWAAIVLGVITYPSMTTGLKGCQGDHQERTKLTYQLRKYFNL